MINSVIEDPTPFECFASRNPATFKRRLRKGPPVQYRWNAWMAQLGISSKLNEEYYANIPQPALDVCATIEKDLDRTFPEEPYFDLNKFGAMG